jgi:hypothetical protein
MRGSIRRETIGRSSEQPSVVVLWSHFPDAALLDVRSSSVWTMSFLQRKEKKNMHHLRNLSECLMFECRHRWSSLSSHWQPLFLGRNNVAVFQVNSHIVTQSRGWRTYAPKLLSRLQLPGPNGLAVLRLKKSRRSKCDYMALPGFESRLGHIII